MHSVNVFDKAVAEVRSGSRLLAVIVSRRFNEPGIHFFTPGELSQRLAYMRHPAGKVIDPHVHNAVRREVHYTQEVLLIRSGKAPRRFLRPRSELPGK